MVSPTDTDMLVDGMNRLFDMGNKVAGFAISSGLLLVFACFKDLAFWVKNRSHDIQIGIVTSNIIYIGGVWCLHFKELAVLKIISPPHIDALRAISIELAEARTVGILFFGLITFATVIETKRGAH
jgi:hypothetical protein